MFHLKLMMSMDKLSLFLDQLPQAGLILDQNGNIINANHIFLQATGYHLSQVIQRPFTRVFSTIESFNDWIEKVLKTTIQGSGLAEVNWINASDRIHKSPVVVFQGSYQETHCFLIAFINISSESDRSIHERFARQLASHNNLGIVLLDKLGNVMDVSEMICQLLDVKKNQIINQHLSTVFHNHIVLKQSLEQTLFDGIMVSNHPISVEKNDQIYELLVDSKIIKDEKGQIVGCYLLAKDITSFRLLGQNIERNDRLAMIGQIAAGTAHEIRNPLTSIKGFLQMLKQSLNEKGLNIEKRYTDIMLSEIERINDLVNEFLLLSKRKDIQYTAVDLNIVFSEILPIVENEALLHGMTVEYLCGGELPSVVGNSEMLKQVFLNICKNGIEAMENEGTLTISHTYFYNSKKVSINIHDTGPGIPPSVMDKIFDPFFTTKVEGTGLGLPVCQKIVHDIRGQIDVTVDETGTTFHIILPYEG